MTVDQFDKIYRCICAICGILGFLTVFVLFIGLVLYFDYYDKTKIRQNKSKREEENAMFHRVQNYLLQQQIRHNKEDDLD